MATPAPPKDIEFPVCLACGTRTACVLVRLANDEAWWLCPEFCFPALLADCRDWLRNEQEHNRQLRAEKGPSPC